MTAHARALSTNAAPVRSASIRAVGDLRLLTWPALEASGADAVVTARSGGTSSGPYATLNLSLSVGDDPAKVLENRRRLAVGLDANPDDFIFARQVHGARVRVVGRADRGSGAFTLADAIDETDALVTTSPGVVLAILTADCVPIVLHDPVVGILACVHAGWRGTVAGVCAAAVAAMQSLGSRSSDVIAGVGPAASPARYQVGTDVYQAVTTAFGAAATAFIRPDSVPQRWLLDLWAANEFVLREAGVPAAQIHVTDLPTGPIDPSAAAIPVGPQTSGDPTDAVPPEYPTNTVSPEDPAETVPPGDHTGTVPSGDHAGAVPSGDHAGTVPSGDHAGTVPSGDHTGTVPPGDPMDPARYGYFFSDRAARPCGRLALAARLRAGRNVGL